MGRTCLRPLTRDQTARAVAQDDGGVAAVVRLATVGVEESLLVHVLGADGAADLWGRFTTCRNDVRMRSRLHADHC
jgi:hypothetical protein